MKSHSDSEAKPLPELTTELLIMPDGKVLAHNLTPAMAAVLGELNPTDEEIKKRTVTHVGAEVKELLPLHWHTPTDHTVDP